MSKVSFRAARVNAGMNAFDASSELGLCTDTLYKYENGSTSPTVDVVKRMAILYGVDVTDFKELGIGDDEEDD